MNDRQLDRLAVGILATCLVATAALLILALVEAQSGEYQRSTIFVAVSFFLSGLAIFVYERAFTPGVIWVMKQGKRAGLIVQGEGVLDPEHGEAK